MKELRHLEANIADY